MTDALLAFVELVSALFLGASQKKGSPEKPTGAFTASLAFFLWGVFFGGPVALLLGGLPWFLSALAALALLAALLAMVRRLGLRLGFVTSVRGVIAYAISFCLGTAALLAVVSPSRLGIHEAKLHSQSAGTAPFLPKHFSNQAPRMRPNPTLNRTRYGSRRLAASGARGILPSTAKRRLPSHAG